MEGLNKGQPNPKKNKKSTHLPWRVQAKFRFVSSTLLVSILLHQSVVAVSVHWNSSVHHGEITQPHWPPWYVWDRNANATAAPDVEKPGKTGWFWMDFGYRWLQVAYDTNGNNPPFFWERMINVSTQKWWWLNGYSVRYVKPLGDFQIRAYLRNVTSNLKRNVPERQYLPCLLLHLFIQQVPCMVTTGPTSGSLLSSAGHLDDFHSIKWLLGWWHKRSFVTQNPKKEV